MSDKTIEELLKEAGDMYNAVYEAIQAIELKGEK
jgi:hypothetical protein